MIQPERRSLTPHLPPYVLACHFLRVMDDVPATLYHSTSKQILEQRGSPQEQVSWTEPDVWIPKRLQGEMQALALRVWRESQGELNPRHMSGSWYLTKKHGLLVTNSTDTLRVTNRGHTFLSEPEGAVVAEIDALEGLLPLLRIMAERGSGKRSDLLPSYSTFCQTFTHTHSESFIKSSLYNRLVNLLERGYLVRRGQEYEVTDFGLIYLERYAFLVPGQLPSSADEHADLRRLAKILREEARQKLADHLSAMDPFKFEGLIRFLLEEMGYNNVEVTAPTNDKGVDVVANIELGISSVREVVQVKRHRSNIGREVLDRLRGSLHRFDAVRGTIISTGGYSKGTVQAAFERGAAPITLIDGEKLLDLLIQHEIGVKKQVIDYLEFDPSKLPAPDEPEEESES